MTPRQIEKRERKKKTRKAGKNRGKVITTKKFCQKRANLVLSVSLSSALSLSLFLFSIHCCMAILVTKWRATGDTGAKCVVLCVCVCDMARIGDKWSVSSDVCLGRKKRYSAVCKAKKTLGIWFGVIVKESLRVIIPAKAKKEAVH